MTAPTVEGRKCIHCGILEGPMSRLLKDSTCLETAACELRLLEDELESLRTQNAALVDALEWMLDAPDVCARCRRAGELCVGHAALSTVRGGG